MASKKDTGYRDHRPLVGGSVDITGASEWRAELKKRGWNCPQRLNRSHIHAFAYDAEGNIVGECGTAGHGPLGGFVSDSHEMFAIDYIDSIVRLQERLAINLEKKRPCIRQSAKTDPGWMAREEAALKDSVRRLKQTIKLRREWLAEGCPPDEF